jgi:Ser/Thr protein kinase RdoA (MazF antagonist)
VEKCDHVGVDAITPAADLVRSWGFDVRDPVSLRSSNNVVVWLSPSPVVAKISRELDRANRELAIARELVALAAPVVHPFERRGIEQPVSMNERVVTFWQYAPQNTVIESSANQVAEYLFRLHSCLASLRDRAALPSVTEPLMSAVSGLERPEFAPGLAEPDRALLRETLVDGVARLARIKGSDQVIHGSPHRFNILNVDGTPKFIDFETVEFGPLEWDLAHLEPAVAAHYPGEIDRQVLELCRVLVSAATSTWCWEGLERGPDMQSHAQHHLEVVRSARS